MTVTAAQKKVAPPPVLKPSEANQREDRVPPRTTAAPARPPASSFYSGSSTTKAPTSSARSQGDAHDNKSSPATLKTKPVAAPAPRRAPARATSARSRGDAHDNPSSPAALKTPVKPVTSSARSRGDAHDNPTSPATLKTDPATAAAIARSSGDAHDNPNSPAALKTPVVPDRSKGDAHDNANSPGALRTEPANAQAVWNTTFTDPGGALYVDGVSSGDVNQGAASDCTMLAGLAGLAEENPQAIKNMITENPDGSVTVGLYSKDANGNMVKDPVTVDRKTAQDVYAHSDTPEEQWVSLVEKAYAQRKGSYANEHVLSQPAPAADIVTGQKTHDAELRDPKTLKAMEDDLATGKVVTASRREGINPDEPGLPTGHAYTVTGTVKRGDKTYVQLRNPWGNTTPSDPYNQTHNDGRFEMTTDEFAKKFNDVTISDPPPPPHKRQSARLPA